MRRGAYRGRWWGGTWGCSRVGVGGWRGSSCLGVVVSVWFCLLTLLHLSLHPSSSPLLLTQPPCQDVPPTQRGLPSAELRFGMGAGGGLVDRGSLLQPAPLGTAAAAADSAGGASLARSPGGKGPDQRVLLTKEDTLNDAANDPLVLEDGTLIHPYPHPQHFLPHPGGEEWSVKENLAESGYSLPQQDKAGETQLERIPVSRVESEAPEDRQRQTAPSEASVSPSHTDSAHRSHGHSHARHSEPATHANELPYSSSSTANPNPNTFHLLSSASHTQTVATVQGKNRSGAKLSLLSHTEHSSQRHDKSPPHGTHSSFFKAAQSLPEGRTKNGPSAVSASVNRPSSEESQASPSSSSSSLAAAAAAAADSVKAVSHPAVSSASFVAKDGAAASSSVDNRHPEYSSSMLTSHNQNLQSRVIVHNPPTDNGSSSVADRKQPGDTRQSLSERGVWGRERGVEVVVGSRVRREGWVQHAYNVTASDLLPMDRPVPDTRPPGCPLEWPDVTSVGPVSIIICTHNEAPSVLRRTVYSVLRQTPSHLLSDVIVVDDNTTIGDPAHALEVIGHDVTRGRLQVLRAADRLGLVRARLLGAKAARGRVLVFLDSHCECGPHWITPLLVALRHDKHKVVSPYIDVIRSESFAFVRSPDNLQGDFNWRLEFGWRAIPADLMALREGPHMPIRTPVISGGLFAVDRQFFFDIGSYDDHMDIWGGENMELSFRVWMCGGQLEIVPCSRVGHVFRSSVPYSFPGDRRHTVLRNLARAAHVWMDEFSPFFFAAVNMTSAREVGDVTSRVSLRQRLGCRSFRWYLKTVAPHLHVPTPGSLQYGQFKNRGSLLCLTSSEIAGSRHLRLLACHGSFNQTVELGRAGSLHMGEGCVSVASNRQLSLSPCSHTPPAVWRVRREQLYLAKTDLCMTAVDNEFVHLQPCRHGNPFQDWEPSYVFSWPP